ncbi:MAG: glycosyltransferase, partial [Acutalibacteraceae bacterium]
MSMFKHSFDFSVITIADSAISKNAAEDVSKFIKSIRNQTKKFDRIQIIFICGKDADAAAQVKKQKKKYPKNITVVKAGSIDFGAYRKALGKATGKYIAFPEISSTYSKKALASVESFFKKNGCAAVKIPVFTKSDGQKSCVDRAYLTKPKVVSLEENPKYTTFDIHSCFFIKSDLPDINKPGFLLELQLKNGEIGINSKAGYNRTLGRKSDLAKLGGFEAICENKELLGNEGALSALSKFAYENGIKEVSGENTAALGEKIKKLYEEKRYEYKISVVLPVYNVENYVEETFASIRRQNIGFFENIQVIFVDDGSPDRSGEICDGIAKKYPYNVVCVHKENGGVSSARNEGLKYVRGKYVNFCDPDDYFKFKATFSAACELFDKNYDEIDIVSLPITFFEGKAGGHPLNKKFENGSRVIDLRYEPWALQISITSAFVKSEVLKKFKFNTNLRISEDGDVTLRILAQKLKLGVCAGYPYMYRRRADNSSALQNSMAKADYFEACMTDYMLAMIDYYKSIHGYVPDSLKYNFAYELQWRVSYAGALNTTVMTDEQVKGYVESFKKVLSYIDDEIIVNNPYASFERKYKMLEIKGTLAPKTELVWNQPAGYKYALTSNGNVVGFYSINPTRIHFADIKDGKLLLEGTSAVINGRFKDVRVDIRVNGKDIPAKALPHANQKVYMWGEPVYDFYAFSCEIDIQSLTLPANAFIVMKCDDIEICKTYITYQKMSKINTKTRNQYYYKDGYVLTATTAEITLEKCDADRRRSLESVYENAISQVKRFSDEEKEEMISLRKDYFRLKPMLKKPIWLVSDRVDLADDNGEAFFKYLIENHSEDVDAYFVLNEESADFDRLSKIGPTVATFSYKHKLLTLLADKVISSSANENTLDPFHPFRYVFEDISNADFIFLQHGVLKGDLSGWLRKPNKNIAGFITSAMPEREAVINQKAYGYGEKEVWLTGLPRFDRLYHDEKKLVTIAPTWRKYLVSDTDFFTGLRPFND